MTVIKQSAWVPYTAIQMYELVNAIEQYPEFLPWCKKTEVHSRSEDEIRATIEVSKGGIRHAFTTLNRLQHNKMIEVRLVEGPFRVLEGFWQFDPLGEQGTRINFYLEFEFVNKLMTLILSSFLKKAPSTLLDAFCRRAKVIYG